MFLADNRRTARIKSRESLLPYKGLQKYENHREEVLNNQEVCHSLFDLILVFRAKHCNFSFDAAEKSRTREGQEVFRTR